MKLETPAELVVAEWDLLVGTEGRAQASVLPTDCKHGWGMAEAEAREVCSSLGLGLILLLNALLSSKVFLTLSNNWILEMDLSEIFQYL